MRPFFFIIIIIIPWYEMLCTMWYHLCNSRTLRNALLEGVLLFIKMQTSAYNFIKSSIPL